MLNNKHHNLYKVVVLCISRGTLRILFGKFGNCNTDSSVPSIVV